MPAVIQTPTERERWIGTERKKADVTNVVNLSGRSWSVPALLFSACLGSFLDPSSLGTKGLVLPA